MWRQRQKTTSDGITPLGGALYLNLCSSKVSIADQYQMNGGVSGKQLLPPLNTLCSGHFPLPRFSEGL